MAGQRRHLGFALRLGDYDTYRGGVFRHQLTQNRDAGSRRREAVRVFADAEISVVDMRSIKSLQPTRDGAFSFTTASGFTSFGPAWLSSAR